MYISLTFLFSCCYEYMMQSVQIQLAELAGLLNNSWQFYMLVAYLPCVLLIFSSVDLIWCVFPISDIQVPGLLKTYLVILYVVMETLSPLATLLSCFQVTQTSQVIYLSYVEICLLQYSVHFTNGQVTAIQMLLTFHVYKQKYFS